MLLTAAAAAPGYQSAAPISSYHPRNVGVISFNKTNSRTGKDHERILSSTSSSHRRQTSEARSDKSSSISSHARNTSQTRCSYETVKSSKAGMAKNQQRILKAYAASTDRGLVRDYNEDRVSIVLNILKPTHKQ